VGETISVKTRPQVDGERRRRGRLVAADDAGFELESDDEGGSPSTVRFAYGEIDRARTVFEWGPATGGNGAGSAGSGASGRGGTGRTPGGKRGKQVVNR
jgi:ribosome maturation factor RimP